MKLLIIGMDGASPNVFDRDWTPRLSAKLETFQRLNLKADLSSRGWVELATGEHAAVTGAFYDRPNLTNTTDWSLSYQLKEYLNVSSRDKCLWEVANDNGMKVGIVNVPTTYPAPEVDGFFISGGGGGQSPSASISEECVYPKSLLKYLENKNYISDLRIHQLIADGTEEEKAAVLTRLTEKNFNKTAIFKELSKRYEIDLGVLIYKTSSVMAENLFHAAVASENPNSSKVILEAIEKYYRQFDLYVSELLEAFPETNVCFVADHGTAPVTHHLNINSFLAEHGLYVKQRYSEFYSWIYNHLRKVVPFKVRRWSHGRVSKTLNRKLKLDFDRDSTIAFCKPIGDWHHGIYINDHERFGGPVPMTHVENYATQIATLINKDNTLLKHGINAVTSLEAFQNKCPETPDILISAPNGYLFSEHNEELIAKIEATGEFDLIQNLIDGRLTTMKATHSLCLLSFEPNSSRKDLNITHRELFSLLLRRLTTI